MAAVVYIVSALSGIYGLMWLIFAFVHPPSAISHYFRAPSTLYFLPDRVGRIAMAVIFAGLIPMFATFIVGMFMG